MNISFFLALILSFITTQDSATRNWQLANQQSIEASFQSFDDGQVVLQEKSGSVRSIPFDELSTDDQKEVMRLSGWGRVWEDDTGKHHFIGDLVDIVEDTVALEKVDGNKITVKLDRLSKVDRQYVEARRDISAEKLPESFTAKVVGIHDGDTVTVLINKRQFKIRIDGIDAPELGQAFSSKSKSFLSTMIGEKVVTGTTIGSDKYGRNLCRLAIGGLSVNAELIRNGLAWHYEQYSDDQEFKQLQAQAIAGKIGIWSESGPIPPWEWRKWSGAQRKNWFDEHSKQSASETKAEAEVAAPQDVPSNALRNEAVPKASQPTKKKDDSGTLNYWLNTSSNVRHNRGCQWFENTKKGRLCGPNEGKACGQCGG